MEVGRYAVKKYKNKNQWAVWDGDDDLVVVAVHKVGAVEVAKRLTDLAEKKEENDAVQKHKR